jgi:hypothetical protein
MTPIEYIKNLKNKIKEADVNELIEVLKLVDETFETYANNHIKFNDGKKDNFADEQEFRKIVFRKLLDKTSTLNQNQITYLWYNDNLETFEMNKCADIYQLDINNLVESLKNIKKLIETNKLLNKLSLNDATLITAEKLKEQINSKQISLEELVQELNKLISKIEKA